MSIKDKFIGIGGEFLIPEPELAKLVPGINTFIFDWDGVFNNGIKGTDKGSLFSEADSMGCNMLRFNHWRITSSMPCFFIVTGENNLTAIDFAKREHFNGVYTNCKNKKTALDNITEIYNVLPAETAFIFDDILDVAAAACCKLAICVRRKASPLFTEFILENLICQYVTGNEGGNNAVREVAELIVGLTGKYSETINKRIEFDSDYQQYLSQRNNINTLITTS